jgi:hypothetical protein
MRPPFQAFLTSPTGSVVTMGVLEWIRAFLVRSERLAAMESLAAKADGQISRLPADFRVILQTIEATPQCFEEWLESPTWSEIVATDPQRTKANVKSCGRRGGAGLHCRQCSWGTVCDV